MIWFALGAVFGWSAMAMSWAASWWFVWRHRVKPHGISEFELRLAQAISEGRDIAWIPSYTPMQTHLSKYERARTKELLKQWQKMLARADLLEPSDIFSQYVASAYELYDVDLAKAEYSKMCGPRDGLPVSQFTELALGKISACVELLNLPEGADSSVLIVRERSTG